MRFLPFSYYRFMVAGTLLFALSDCSGDEFTQEGADASVDSGSPQEASTGGSGGTSTGGAGGATGGSGGAPTGGSGGAPTGGAGGATGGTGASAGHGGTGGDAGPEPTCDPNESPPTDAIYVSAKEGDDNASQGSPEQPLQSLSNAIKLAVHNQIGKIILDQGTYKEAVVLSLQDPLVIMGGWIKVGTSWTRDCSQTARNKTLLHSPTSTGLEITGNNSVSLQTMVIQSTGTNNAAPDNQSGESCYGVFVSGAQLSMNDVTIRACGGQDGGKADKLEEVQPPDCSQLQGAGCSTGVSGTSGGGGENADVAGQFTANGYIPQYGQHGISGQNGKNGKQGKSGNSAQCYGKGCAGTQVSGPCPSNHFCGNETPQKDTSSQPGSCGCGGRGGGGGAGGRGGGGSFGIYATGNASVLVKNSRVEAASGGNGSPGQQGNNGLTGLDGETGNNAICYTQCKPTQVGANCNCEQPDSYVLAGGEKGGKGGDGGNGGPGGAGSGGPSIAALIHGSATINHINVDFLHSTAGTPGAPSAAQGDAKDILEVQ